MDSKIEQCKWESVCLCEKLISDMNVNKEDVNKIFGNEILNAYLGANNNAIKKAKSILNKINNL